MKSLSDQFEHVQDDYRCEIAEYDDAIYGEEIEDDYRDGMQFYWL